MVGCTNKRRTGPEVSLLPQGHRLTECSVIDLGTEELPAGGKLTPLWAQEYIGADLAKEYLATLANRQLVGVGIIDSGHIPNNLKSKLAKDAALRISKEGSLDPWGPSNWLFNTSHSKSVTNLILHSRYGSALDGEITGVAGRGGDYDYKKAVNLFVGSRSKVINMSLLIDPHESIYKHLSRFAENNQIVVISAGNYYPRPIESALARLRAIVVGSLSPDGLVSSFSIQGNKVSVLAPSDYFIYSTEDGEKPQLFGGTSGAAPLVSGAIMNVASLIPHLSYGQADELLRFTSIPLPSNRDFVQNNGYGMLNAYKLVRAAERVRGVKPLQSSGEMRRALRRVDFREEAQQEYSQAMSLLIHKDCEQVTEGFKALRKSFLLDYEGPARAALAEAYGQLGFTFNSSFYGTIDPRLTDLEIAERVLDESLPSSEMIFWPDVDKEFGLSNTLKGMRGYNFASRFSKGSPIVRLARERTLEKKGFARAERALWLHQRGDDIYRKSQQGLGLESRKKIMGYELDLVRKTNYEPRRFLELLRFLKETDAGFKKLAYDNISFEIYMLEREKQFSFDSYGVWKTEQLSNHLAAEFGYYLSLETDPTTVAEIWEKVRVNFDTLLVDISPIFLLSLMANQPEGPLATLGQNELDEYGCAQIERTLRDIWDNNKLKNNHDDLLDYTIQLQEKLCQQPQPMAP